MGKRMEAAVKAYDKAKVYTMEEAAQIVKDNAKAKFDETVEIHVKLGIDTRKADQIVRGAVVLPNGTGKTKRIAVIAKGEHVQMAEKAGADRVGAEDIVEEILKGKIDFDVLVATPDTMKDLVAKTAKVLGPRGLMPTPKTGTVTFEIEKTIKDLKAGRVAFKADAYGIVHTVIGKASFDAAKLVENAKAIMDTIIHAKPSTSKGVYVRSVSFSSTMGPGVFVSYK